MIKNLSIGGSSRGMLLLALLFGAVCAVLVGVYLSSLEKDGGTSAGVSGATVPVVVAAQDIPAQTAITADMVTLKEVPADLVLVGGFAETGLVVGKRTEVKVVTGQQILATNAVDATSAEEIYGPDKPLSLVVPEGMRGFSIFVSKLGAAGGLARAGDYVDVVMSGAPLDETGQARNNVIPGRACVIMQNIQVLAVADIIRAAGTDTSAIAGVAANPEATTITLAVTPDQSAQLAAAQVSVDADSPANQVWVALRAHGDHSPADTPICVIPTGL